MHVWIYENRAKIWAKPVRLISGKPADSSGPWLPADTWSGRSQKEAFFSVKLVILFARHPWPTVPWAGLFDSRLTLTQD